MRFIAPIVCLITMLLSNIDFVVKIVYIIVKIDVLQPLFLMYICTAKRYELYVIKNALPLPKKKLQKINSNKKRIQHTLTQFNVI